MNRTARRAAERQANKLANKETSRLLANLATASPALPAVEPISESRPLPTSSEISPARLAANRENALKSTGPVTAQGKFVSSRNHTTHGLARKNRDFQLLPFENVNEFHRTVADFISEYSPKTASEVALVHALAESLWLRNRAQNFQTWCFDESGILLNEKKLELYIRYEATYNRAFNTALNQLLKLRAERREEMLGFEAQKRVQANHQWEIVRKEAAARHQIGKFLLQKKAAIEQNPGFESQIDSELTKIRTATA
jgi:hypothetical protein